ncbi:UDP-N-acetylmuramate:L-alanyl-gamma-D-glutamyl-meso-diaminopimelate ligase [candidate division KSB1 bacterium]|nr:UDP-N-acetylmuramate:L-alanyl-gamma-D-glutamyl-meso-diaminopimelate ligase [candidate division KSB1 bacterium]RQW00401.1 MAG: UDP-N-acetylmuramate:L-alanyl-gamma-D-glutamyl-meso-diaminopimelate ligase [candidate division KSB1 bacterium]
MIEMNLQRDTKKRIYFLAICGTAMASLAAMMKAKDYEVYGVDEGIYPPMSDFLAEQKIPVFDGFDPGHLVPAPDLVVVGNVISRGNVELEEILDRHIPYISLPDALRDFIIRGKRSIVVTGTHGKTTTTSMLAWIFDCAERHPSFMVGGIPKNFGRGFQLDNGDDFIIEGDEYDSAYFDKVAKFLRYIPDIGIINAIEFDHADIYDSLDDIKLAFRRFVNLIPRSGLLVACKDDANTMEIAEKAFCPVATFGLAADADWRGAMIESAAQGIQFNVYKNHDLWGQISLLMPGEHNVRNALAAIAVADFAGIPKATILHALATYQGVKRRLELVGSVNGLDIYDDFGHHPTAIRETLAAFRAQHPNRRIWALYEPRSATSRRNIFQKQFAESFDDADFILVAPVHRPDKAPPDQLFSVQQLAEDLEKRGKSGNCLTVEDMVKFIKERAQKDDVIITFSNGPFDGIHEHLLNGLR